jgi:hypothetical protein
MKRLLTMLALVAAAVYAGGISGQVVDAATGEPIAGYFRDTLLNHPARLNVMVSIELSIVSPKSCPLESRQE